jgi:hypothetical protein
MSRRAQEGGELGEKQEGVEEQGSETRVWDFGIHRVTMKPHPWWSKPWLLAVQPCSHS